jgi:hypothetical protein
MLVIVGGVCANAHRGGRPSAYYPPACGIFAIPRPLALNPSLHSPQRQLIELRIEHADLDALIDRCAPDGVADEFTLRRLKKRRLALRDALDRLERDLQPQEPA